MTSAVTKLPLLFAAVKLALPSPPPPHPTLPLLALLIPSFTRVPVGLRHIDEYVTYRIEYFLLGSNLSFLSPEGVSQVLPVL